ncbi:MAG: dihydrolipoamide acetyltransferase family protein [Mycobacteriales bacterium]
MSRVKQFKLPDLGEGLTEGEILKWLVQPGDVVKINQPIVEVETAKAAVEVPSPFAGVVTELFHPEGATVDVGSPLIAFDTEPGAGPLVTEPASGDVTANRTELEATDAVPATPDDEPQAGTIGGTAPGGRTSVLVGYGPRSTTAKRRKRVDRPTPDGASSDGQQLPAPPTPGRAAAHAVSATGRVKAKPPVRKLAKDLGVDLLGLTGTGPDGVVTRDDVQLAATGAGGNGQAAAFARAPRRTADGPREERIPIKGVRKLTAQAMVTSAFTAPHVTEFITVDVTPAMDLRTALAALPEFAGLKVSPLLLVAKALLVAVRRNPQINSTWDEAAQEIVVKNYVNLGIAAATPRGLIVPNIKDADSLSLPELAHALHDLTATARDGKTLPADMQGGTITITNVGTFGVDNGTPILNPGESAILCFGAVRPMPWVHEGEIAIRQVTQLSLSFDHRIVDGQLGSQFLADIAKMLADPAALIAWS